MSGAEDREFRDFVLSRDRLQPDADQPGSAEPDEASRAIAHSWEMVSAREDWMGSRRFGTDGDDGKPLPAPPLPEV